MPRVTQGEGDSQDAEMPGMSFTESGHLRPLPFLSTNHVPGVGTVRSAFQACADGVRVLLLLARAGGRGSWEGCEWFGKSAVEN